MKSAANWNGFRSHVICVHGATRELPNFPPLCCLTSSYAKYIMSFFFSHAVSVLHLVVFQNMCEADDEI